MKNIVGISKNEFNELLSTWGQYPELKPYKVLLCHDNGLVIRRCDNVEDTVITCIKTSDKCIRVVRVGRLVTNKFITFTNYSSCRNCVELARRLQTYAKGVSPFRPVNSPTISERLGLK